MFFQIPSPNFTLIPNFFFDELKNFSDAETRIMLILMRHQDCEYIDLVDLAKKWGLKINLITESLESLFKKNYIKRVPISASLPEKFSYSLVYEDEVNS